MQRKSGAPKDDEIEVTPEMIEAGVKVMSENYLALTDGDEFPEIAKTVYKAMEVCRRVSGGKVHKT